jgi:HEAT repeat protein
MLSGFERWLLGGLFVSSLLIAAGVWPSASRAVVVKQLEADLRSPTLATRQAAYGTVRRYGPAAGAVAPILIEQLERGRNYDAINALLGIGPRASLDPLLQALNDQSTAPGAAVMIGVFGPQARRARAALLRALEDPEVRPYAERALQAIDGDGRDPAMAGGGVPW